MNNISFIEIKPSDVFEWQRHSKLGEVCGIFNCEEKPAIQCPLCDNWYCYEHKTVHFHASQKENVLGHDDI